jgi:hypothetical protein
MAKELWLREYFAIFSVISGRIRSEPSLVIKGRLTAQLSLEGQLEVLVVVRIGIRTSLSDPDLDHVLISKESGQGISNKLIGRD